MTRGGHLWRLAAILLMLQLAPGRVHASNSRWTENPARGAHFDSAGVQGCFLLYDAQRDEYGVFNGVRARERFLPASTYKIPNSLIALETGVVRDENEVLKWDRVKRRVPSWNHDQNMRDAFKN